MKKIFQGSMIAGLALLGSVLPLQAQDRSASDQANNIPYGTRAGEFLLLPVGARATAMGSAFSAAANDISALFWNPGGLATSAAKGAMVSHLDYVAETTHTWAGVSFPFAGGERALGFQVGVFGFDDQPEYTVENPNGTGRSYSVSNSVLGLTYAQRFNDRFSFGLTGKYISEDLAGVKGTAFAADFGAHYQTEVGGRPIKGGFVISNLGGQLKHTGTQLQQIIPTNDPNLPAGERNIALETKGWDLPTAFKIGVAYDVMSAASNRLTLAGEFIQPAGNDVSGAFGAEYAMMNVGGSDFGFALRGGWNYEPDNNLDVAASSSNGMNNDGMSAGGGISYNIGEQSAVGLDYAYRDMGLLGGRNMFSLGVRW